MGGTTPGCSPSAFGQSSAPISPFAVLNTRLLSDFNISNISTRSCHLLIQRAVQAVQAECFLRMDQDGYVTCCTLGSGDVFSEQKRVSVKDMAKLPEFVGFILVLRLDWE